jgi:hypothetical protein
MGWSPSGTLWPVFGPPTIWSFVGVPRLGLVGLARSFGLSCLAAGLDDRASAGAFVPMMSERMTETAESTNNHSTARKPILMRVSVSSDTVVEPALVGG